jgi:hypothetical protein
MDFVLQATHKQDICHRITLIIIVIITNVTQKTHETDLCQTTALPEMTCERTSSVVTSDK